jgi:hypothetical protein
MIERYFWILEGATHAAWRMWAPLTSPRVCHTHMSFFLFI